MYKINGMDALVSKILEEDFNKEDLAARYVSDVVKSIKQAEAEIKDLLEATGASGADSFELEEMQFLAKQLRMDGIRKEMLPSKNPLRAVVYNPRRIPSQVNRFSLDVVELYLEDIDPEASPMLVYLYPGQKRFYIRTGKRSFAQPIYSILKKESYKPGRKRGRIAI